MPDSVCPSCGTRLHPDSEFCHECGIDVSDGRLPTPGETVAQPKAPTAPVQRAGSEPSERTQDADLSHEKSDVPKQPFWRLEPNEGLSQKGATCKVSIDFETTDGPQVQAETDTTGDHKSYISVLHFCRFIERLYFKTDAGPTRAAILAILQEWCAPETKPSGGTAEPVTADYVDSLIPWGATKRRSVESELVLKKGASLGATPTGWRTEPLGAAKFSFKLKGFGLRGRDFGQYSPLFVAALLRHYMADPHTPEVLMQTLRLACHEITQKYQVFGGPTVGSAICHAWRACYVAGNRYIIEHPDSIWFSRISGVELARLYPEPFLWGLSTTTPRYHPNGRTLRGPTTSSEQSNS